MSLTIQLVVDGIIIGAVYAVVGLGVVIVFRTTNVLNFSQGAVATIAGYLAWNLMEGSGLPYGVALVVAMLVGGLLGLAIGALVTFVLVRSSPLTKSVATLGVFLFLGWVARRVFGDVGQVLDRPFAGSFEVGGIFFSGHGLFVAVLAFTAIGATFLLIEKTRLGLAMRALASDEETARGHGISLVVTSLAAWFFASALGAGSGVLVGSFIQVDHSIMNIVLLYSIAALVVGGFGTASGAVVGGLAVGIFSSLMSGFASPSYKNTFVFALILAILIFRPNGLLGKAAITVPETVGGEDHPRLPRPGTWKLPRSVLSTAAIALLIVAIPFLPHPFSLLSYSVMLATAVVVVSLSLLMGYSGEISLGHGALVTVGAYTTALILAQFPGTPFWIALLASAAAAAIVGAGLGLVTLRLSGIYFAIATLALIYVVQEVALQFREFTGGAAGINIGSPVLFGDIVLTGDRSIYYMTAVILALVLAAVVVLTRSPIGQRWTAVRDAPIAAESSGVSVKSNKVSAFVVSSAIAGLGGSLLTYIVTFVSPFDYDLFYSIFVILAVILGGSGSWAGAILGAAFISLVPVALSRSSGLTDALFGIALVLLLVVAPSGLRGFVEHRRKRAEQRLTTFAASQEIDGAASEN